MATRYGIDWSSASPIGSRPTQLPSGGAQPGRARPVRAADPAQTVLGLLALCALTTALTCIAASRLIWNRTPSLPLGVYLRSPDARAGYGDLVALRVPPNVRQLVHERHYLPGGSLLIKPVAAVAGDEVCVRRGLLTINGTPFGRILTRDSAGRELPTFAGCGVLPDGQVFLASHHPRSFDSRSFGPVDVHALQGTVTPLWTY